MQNLAGKRAAWRGGALSKGGGAVGRAPAAIAAVLLACLASVGCAAKGSPAQRPLVLAQLGRVDHVNELLADAGEHSRALSRLLFLPLLRERADFAEGPPTYEPLLAESWERSADGRTLTFHLRPGLVWSDGEPLTADDVRFTWLAQTSDAIAWPLAPSENLLDVEVVDPRTVRFRFVEPAADQLVDAVGGGILPRHAWSQLPFESWRSSPHWFAEHLVVSGPYIVSEWAAPDRVVLRANPRYMRRGLPRLERVVLRFSSSEAALLSMLAAGEADFVAPVPPRERSRLDANAELETVEYPTRQVTFLSWNLERPWFSDPAVRRALALAIDRQEIVDTLWFGAAIVACSPIPSSVWAHDGELSPLPHDPAAARALLDQAGWVDRDGDGVRDRDGMAFRFEILTNTSNEPRWDALQMIRADLAQLGIEVVPRRLELQAVTAVLARREFDAVITAFGIDTHLDLSFAFHGRSVESGYNYGGYRNPRVDALLDEIGAATDRGAKLQEFHELQRALHEDQPVLFLWEPRGLAVHASRLRQVRPNPLSVIGNLEEWTWG